MAGAMTADAFGDNDKCPGCGHSLSRHYLTPRQDAHCMVVETVKGTIALDGKPFGRACSCKNGARITSSVLMPDQD